MHVQVHVHTYTESLCASICIYVIGYGVGWDAFGRNSGVSTRRLTRIQQSGQLILTVHVGL